MLIKIKFLVDEDFVNYKKPNMFIGFPYCSFKCDKESRQKICQNSSLIYQKNYKIDSIEIISRYLKNPLTEAIVFGGLEPLDSFEELIFLIKEFRKYTQDEIVIYTGYKEEELDKQIKILKENKNIIIKFGRFIPNQEKHFDNILGINLSSSNQYAKKIS